MDMAKRGKCMNESTKPKAKSSRKGKQKKEKIITRIRMANYA